MSPQEPGATGWNSTANTTNGTVCPPQDLHPAIPVLLALLSVGGLVLNSLSLWIFWVTIKRWNASVLLQFNLAVVDTVLLPVTPLLVTYVSLGKHWPFGQFLCQFQVFMLNTHLYGSVYSLTLISVHRYQAIAHYSRSCWMKKAFLKKLFVAFWLLLVLQGLPVFFFQKTTSGAGHAVKCLSVHQAELPSPYVNYGLALLVGGFLLPFAVSLAAHLKLGAYLSTISDANIRKKLTKTKSIQILTVALVIFAVCFTPFHACQALGAFVRDDGLSCERRNRLEAAYFVSLVLSVANCCLDPFIYNFANDKFHQFVRRLLRW